MMSDSQISKLYKEGSSILEIAETMSLSPITIRRRLKRLGIGPNSRRKSTEEFSNEVRDLTGFEYQVLSEYVNAHTKIEMIHHSCGNIINITPNNFLKGRRCAHCSEGGPKTTNNFLSEVQKLVGEEYTVLGEYSHSNAKITFRHNKCQKEFMAAPRGFLDGRRCPHCAANARKTTDNFSREVEIRTNGEFQIIGDYVNSTTPIQFKHIPCGYSFDKKPKDFLKILRCPKCFLSKQEQEIAKALDKFQLKYTIDTKWEECRDIRPLAFDFAVYHKDSLLCLIDCNGIHHYEPIGPISLSDVRKKDAIKKNFCLKNQIPYLTLPYWDTDYANKWLEHEIDILLNYQQKH
jgi:hypothetical protein